MQETPTVNFSSEDAFIEYFKHASLSEWGFDSYKKYITTKSRLPPRSSTIYASYRLCLRNLSQLKDLSAEAKLVVDSLMNDFDLQTQEHHEEQPSNTTNYYNYGPIGSIGIQGNLSVIPTKRTHEVSSSLVETEVEEETREVSPSAQSTVSTDGTYEEPGTSGYGEILLQRRYVLTLNEFSNNHFDNKTIHHMDNNLSLDERLRLSFINFYEVCPAELLLCPVEFNEDVYREIRNWRRAISVKTEYFPLQIVKRNHTKEDKLFQRDLGTFLLNLKETLERPPLHNAYKQSEVDFSIENVSGLFRFIFNSRSNINFCWEQRFATHKGNTEKMVRTDFLIYSGNQELGVGEVKLNCADVLKEEDRARLGETMKKQLNHRIKQAKSSKEFHVFGIFVVGKKIELYCSSFSKEKGYCFVLLKEITLPTTKDTYTAIEESLEILFSFKKLIKKSLQSPSDLEKPYIYSDYTDYLKPTVSFIK